MTPGNSLIRSNPEEQGISSVSILNFIFEAEKNIHELHSLMLLRHGRVVAEGWWNPYQPSLPHMLWSLSKSFTSTGIGLAVMEGRLSVEDTVLSFFPEYGPATVSENLAAMRVRDLLSMSTGHAEDTTESLVTSKDGNWIKTFLSLPVSYPPGTHFLYNTGATYILSAIVQKVTGMKLLDYLTPRLLEPLGIEGATWETSPQGINTGGFGLSIKTEDIARFGQLYLQKGMWNGKRILSSGWIQEATTCQIENAPNTNPDWAQGYGFQFWRSRHDAYRGDGACGQFCLILPEQDAVLAITAGVDDMQGILDHVWEILLPAMGPGPSAEDISSQRQMTQKLASLHLPFPQGNQTSPWIEKVSDTQFSVEENPSGIESLSFKFSESDCLFTMKTRIGLERITCGKNAWIEGVSTMLDQPSRIVACGVWTAEDTYSMVIRFIETPFYVTVNTQFMEDRIRIESKFNVSFGNLAFLNLSGKIMK